MDLPVLFLYFSPPSLCLPFCFYIFVVLSPTKAILFLLSIIFLHWCVCVCVCVRACVCLCVGHETAGMVSLRAVYEIAQVKSQDECFTMQNASLETVVKSIIGSARSLGIKVVKE